MSTGTNQEEPTYYSIGQASKLTGVKQTVLRFWESEFAQLSPMKNKFGHRVYKDEDLKVVLRIKKLLYEEGHTINGARKIMESPQQPESTTKKIDTKYLRESLEEMLRLINERKSR